MFTKTAASFTCFFAIFSSFGLWAQTGSHFVHGSWVHVREKADLASRAQDQLVTNTPLEVIERNSNWCAVRYGAGKTGYMACNFLGAAPLTLAQASKEPAREFWVAPSPNRIAAYGKSLVPPPHLKMDVIRQTYKVPQEVRYPKVPEFEAAKKHLQAGVVLNPAHEINRGQPVDLAGVFKPYQLKAPVPKLSYFLTHSSVALASETDADGYAAVARSRVSMQQINAKLPMTWHNRHNGPEPEGVFGFWDVAEATLSFQPPLGSYSIASNGLVAATGIRKIGFSVGGEGHYCGGQFLSKSFPEATTSYHSMENFEATPIVGFPVFKDSTLVLASFTTDQPFQKKSVNIRSHRKTMVITQLSDDKTDLKLLETLKPEAVFYEIDLDKDGVADIVMLNVPTSIGNVSGGLMQSQRWFVNINGQWFNAGQYLDEDCT